jgi:hypothetical protein
MILTMATAIGIHAIIAMAITAGNAPITRRRRRPITPARRTPCSDRRTSTTALRRFGVNPRRHGIRGGARPSRRVG